MCTAMKFDASFDCVRFFFSFFAENCQKIGFLNLCQLFLKFLSGCTNNKCELGFVMLSGLPGEAVGNIPGYARSQISGVANELFGCRTIFVNHFCPWP